MANLASIVAGEAHSARSLVLSGERVGVRELPNYRETLTPHPSPLPMVEGAGRPRFADRLMPSKQKRK
jgi:hypothetical protein